MTEPVRTWEQDGFYLELGTSKTIVESSFHRWALSYKFFDGDVLIFQGNDFSPSPFDAIDSDAAVYGCLFFLSLGKGDVDDEYFESYTQEQLDWRDSDRREELAWLVHEYETKDEEE